MPQELQQSIDTTPACSDPTPGVSLSPQDASPHELREASDTIAIANAIESTSAPAVCVASPFGLLEHFNS